MLINDQEIIADFVVESREHLAGIENRLLSIEAAGADADQSLIDTVFRAIHSMKGAAGFLGLTNLSQLAHATENVLNLMRNRQLVASSAVTNILLRAADKLRAMVDDVQHSDTVDASEEVNQLQGIVNGSPVEGAAPATPASSMAPLADEEAPVDYSAEGNYVLEADPSPIAATPPAESLVPVEVPAVTAPVASTAMPTPAATSQPASASQPSGVSPADSSIRVNVGVLDRLMNLAGEMVLARNQLLQLVNSEDRRQLDAVASRVDQVTSEIQEAIMQTRLQPVGSVFNRFPRIVRDLAMQLNKQCQLQLEGQEVEVDKSILESIVDPLTHLIRNSLDHGIESPEARVAAGKSAMGTVALRAFHQAGKVNLVISDDGKGIDAAKLKELAVARGLMTPEQARAMSEREALLIIFKPGFSTAEKVTQVSGRGVGMDVVKTNIERLGGTVSIETQVGRGTTIQIKLPLTLAIIPSLIVRCGGRRFAVPQTSIRELVRVSSRDASKRIERLQHAEVFRLRGSLLPLVRLNHTLALTSGVETDSTVAHILVVEAGHLRYGLVVDGLQDSEEIVVKPLGRHLKRCPCLAGATIHGDGTVGLILDLSGIAVHCGLTLKDADHAAENAGGEAEVGEEKQSLLMFSNDPAELFAVPVGLVARLERITRDRIQTIGGQEVCPFQGHSLPLLSLEQQIRARPRLEADTLHVVVFQAGGRELGLIVPKLLDIREMPLHLDTVTFREPGVFGSMFIDDRMVRVLDLHELARHAHPEWFVQQPPQAQTISDEPATVLVAEDSDFFRRQMSGFLEAEGYRVVSYEDGQAALDALQAQEHAVDIVVTDIEMPRMTGLQLADAIRNDPLWAHLPIIAVTSLAGDEDVARGKAVGIDDYQIKLDRDQVVAAVGKYLRKARQHALVKN